MNLKKKVLLTIGTVAAAAAIAGGGSFATFDAQATNGGNTFATGTLVLSNKVNSGTTCFSTTSGTTDTNSNSACDKVFNLTIQSPGASGTANLTLKNEGSLDGSSLEAFSSSCTNADASAESYHGTGNPCSKVQLYVQQYSDSGFSTPSACLYGGGTSSTCDFSDTAKTLSNFVTTYSSSGSGLSVGAMTSGTSVYIKIGVKLPSDANNTFQGRAATMDMSWYLAS